MSNTNVVRTAIASITQTCQYLGKQVRVYPNSTLNQKLNIFPDLVPTEAEIPKIRYLAIGNGGHNFVVGSNNRVKFQAVPHLARHAALYNQLPFVLRRPSEDLTAQERLRYRLRVIESHGGEVYVAYYLRVLDLSTTEAGLEYRHVENGVTTSTPYSPTLEDLSPVPPTLVAGQAVGVTGDYIASSAKIPFVMTAEEVEEFVNACRIIEGEDGYAIISEVATVTAVDRALSGDFNGAIQPYTECIYAQVSSFITSAWVMEFQTDGIRMTIDVGNVEPLLATSVLDQMVP